MNAAKPKLAVPIGSNHLFYGDNLEILRDHIPDESVDLFTSVCRSPATVATHKAK